MENNSRNSCSLEGMRCQLRQASLLGKSKALQPEDFVYETGGAPLHPLSVATTLGPFGSCAEPGNPEAFSTRSQRIGILGSLHDRDTSKHPRLKCRFSSTLQKPLASVCRPTA